MALLPDFLSLVKRFAVEVQMTGTPTTVKSQKGEFADAVRWIKQAWIDVQEESTDFLFREKTDETLETTGKKIALPDDFDTAIALTIDGGPSCFVDRRKFDQETLTANSTSGKPFKWTIKGNEIEFSVTPNGVYPLKLIYTQRPQELTENTDVPLLPERWRMAIVYKAMEYYGLAENAPQELARGTKGYAEMLQQLMTQQRPPIRRAGPIA